MRVTIPEAPKPKKRGGPDFHKPDCQCLACKARRRKAETLALADRDGAPPVSSEESLSDVIVVDNKTMRGRVASWARMKSKEPDITNREIASRLGISPNTLSNCLQKARKEGWLVFEDPLNKIQYEMIPKVTDQMINLVDAGDQKAIIEAFKQIVAPTYKDAQGIREAAANNIIAIKIEMPPADQMPVVQGIIVGSGRVIDGEVEDK